MTDKYCNQSLTTGNDDGSDWDTHAFQQLNVALNGSNIVAGDTLYVKNNGGTTGTSTIKGTLAWEDNPPRVIACKSATTATPPANSDLIPGVRTGQSTFAYDDAGVPTFTVTNSSSDIAISGYFGFVYGIKFIAADQLKFSSDKTAGIFEECFFKCGTAQTGEFEWGNDPLFSLTFKRCKITAGTAGFLNAFSTLGDFLFEECIFDIPADPMMAGKSLMRFDSCDFSSRSGALVSAGGGENPIAKMRFFNCKIHNSSALVSGSSNKHFRTEFIQTSSASGKTTGQTFREIDIITDNGNIVEETTRFRTNGADDGGSGPWSLAFTPGIDRTHENYVGLVGPKMAIEVVGDGTSQTLTVFIANSSASTDYQDDEVWMVVKSPSEAGTANHDFYTTQLDLLASASNVTDDTGSAWGSGANNHQKLAITLAPDYDGIIECYVVFAKNFSSSPETLYVDPLPVLS